MRAVKVQRQYNGNNIGDVLQEASQPAFIAEMYPN